MAFTCDQLFSCILVFFILFLINTTPCSSRVPTSAPPPPVPSQTHKPVASLPTHTRPLVSLQTLLGANIGTSGNGISELKKYLSKHGYMDFSNSNSTNLDLFDHELESALRKYQLYFKLNVNGTLDSHTVNKLLSPRCGMPDHSPQNISVSFAFLKNDQKWPAWKRNLTYGFPAGTRHDALKPIAAALKEWESVSEFKFQLISNYHQADIKISFHVRDHGDGHPFDGPGGVVGHTMLPITKGKIHLDGDENWIDGVKRGRLDIQSVVAHELGHVLGLGHSSHPEAVMYPYISYAQRKGLASDDIAGIRALYKPITVEEYA